MEKDRNFKNYSSILHYYIIFINYKLSLETNMRKMSARH